MKAGLERDEIRLSQILLLAAWKMITKSWFKAPPPPVDQWRGNLKKKYLMEKTTAQLHVRPSGFNDIWALIKHLGWPSN